MSYKTELQSNNVDLQGILDKVNALPEMEEAPELPTLSNPAAAAQILSGYEVLDQHGIKLTGIMEDNGAVSQALNAGGSYTIPAGYHNGSGKVTSNSLASQTSATAAAADIASGKTAWVNGSKVTGTLVPASVVSGTIQTDTYDEITIPALKGKNNFILAGAPLSGDGGAMGKADDTIYNIMYINGTFVMAVYNNRSSGKPTAVYNVNENLQFNSSTGKITTDSYGFYNNSYSDVYHYVGW